MVGAEDVSISDLPSGMNMIGYNAADNVKRYHLNEDVKDINTKIQFKNNEYFIFPLIMFKNFHVQFDGEANIISFYTTNKDILEVKKKKRTK